MRRFTQNITALRLRSSSSPIMAKRTTKTNLEMRVNSSIIILSILFLLVSPLLNSSAFQSDELLLDDDEFGLEGGRTPSPVDPDQANPIRTPSSNPTIRKRSSSDDSDSKVQFSLEHSFGDSDFVAAGTFTARLRIWSHGGKTLTKLRFSRNALTELEREKFEKLLKEDDFYRIRLPSNVLSSPGKDYVISSVKARCLVRDSLDEHFVIYTEGVNILGVNYGAPGACPYPRVLKYPRRWVFSSNTVLKSGEQAPRAPAFMEDILSGENIEGEIVPQPERSFWAKYWMYMVPLVFVVINVVSQVMNMPEEQGGQAAVQSQQSSAAVRRR